MSFYSFDDYASLRAVMDSCPDAEVFVMTQDGWLAFGSQSEYSAWRISEG